MEGLRPRRSDAQPLAAGRSGVPDRGADPTHLARLPFLPFADPKLTRGPGVQPLDPATWLERDAAFAAQMALRDGLVAEKLGAVTALIPEGAAALEELLALVCDALRADPGYGVAAEITRPDGATVDLSDPLPALARLVQEDLLLLDRPEGAAEHRLLGGVLCFPARWSLAQKMARGLLAIHEPIPYYAEALGARVQRLFDAIRPDRPLWRANWLLHTWPELHQPAEEKAKKPRRFETDPIWLRMERQTLRRLPGTGAVVFGIKTSVAPIESLTAEEGRVLTRVVAALPEIEYRFKGGDVLLARLNALYAPDGPLRRA
ncbi:MAG: DUF3445 domain-containing protein [Pseudomonadota bacterium]